MVMFNNGDDLEVFDRALFRQNLQYMQTGTTASTAAGTCGAAIIIQRQGNFLSGDYSRSALPQNHSPVRNTKRIATQEPQLPFPDRSRLLCWCLRFTWLASQEWHRCLGPLTTGLAFSMSFQFSQMAGLYNRAGKADGAMEYLSHPKLLGSPWHSVSRHIPEGVPVLDDCGSSLHMAPREMTLALPSPRQCVSAADVSLGNP